MKLKMHLRIKQATVRTLYSYVGILSLLVNTSSPFLVALQTTAYAQEISAPVEESVPADAPSEEPAVEESAPTEEAPAVESAPAEEVTVETVTEPTITEEVLGTSTGDPATEPPTEPIIEEPQQGDILPDGASDYRPEEIVEPAPGETAPIDSAPAVEVVTDTTDATDPLIEQIEGVATEIEKECLVEGTEITDSSAADWAVDSEKSYAETKEPVKLGVKYIFPIDNEVSVTFKCLPGKESDLLPLKIERINGSDLELPDGLIIAGEYAYDITTGMENGTFEYDLTLPKYEGIDVGISYIEKSVDEVVGKDLKRSDIKEVDEDSVENLDSAVEISNLDHMTIVFPITHVSCQNDLEINDVAGQKDLTLMCYGTDVATEIFTRWNWDDISWSGNNTGDACNLFDTDGDGDVNYAICVTIGDSPAQIQSTTRYSCGDDKPDRCTSPSTLLPVSSNTECEVATVTNDPFAAGSNYPQDTQATCKIDLSDVGGLASARLVDVCSYPSQQPNSDPSDCIIATQAQTGSLEIVKDLIPSSDAGKFDLLIDGVAGITEVGDGGTTGEKTLLTGNHTFGEVGNGTTSLTNYDISAVCKDNNGTGSIVSTTGSNPWTLSISKDQDIVCTITNAIKSATLTVIKHVVNDNNGSLSSSDFTINVTGTDVSLSTFSGAESPGTTVTMKPGSYSVAENSVTGYAPSYSSDCSGTLVSGDNKTCTITNDDQAGTLIVKKVVVNNNGGLLEADDFTFKVGDGAPVSFEADGQNDLTVNAGTYTITEPAVSGYSTTYDNCTSVGVSIGETETCTITNDDLPGTLIVKKTMTNNNGGTKAAHDFTFSVNSGTAVPFEFDGQNNLTVDAGTYSVVEPSVPGYTATYDNCTDVVIPNGGSATCTINNNDQPAVIVVNKIIVDGQLGDKGVTDFSFKFDLSGAGNHQFESDGSNEVMVAPGTYTVLENEDSRYSTTYDNCENIAVTNGDREICTITNTPNQGSVSGIKWDDTNADGIKDAGEQVIPGWTIDLKNLGGVAVASITTDSEGEYEFSGYYIGDYQVCESTADTSWVATYPNGACHDVSLDLGRDVEDKDFGNFKLGKITACKYEDLNGNGQKEDGDFALDNISMILSKQVDSSWIPQPTQETGENGCTVFTGLTVGQYRVAEDYTDPDLAGYYSSNSVTQQDFSITSGSDVTANFLNAQFRTISGQKYEDLNGNGQKDSGEPGLPDWTIFIETNGNGILDAGETSVTTDADGNYLLTNLVSDTYRIREVQESGWTRTAPVVGYIDVDLHDAYSSSDNNFGNFKLASITACKYVDSGVLQDTEENGIQSTLYTQGWGVTLTTDRELTDPQTTGENGCYTWEGLGPNTGFSVTEESRDFWTPNGPTSCDFSNLTSGSNNICDFHNVQQMPELFITKDNDSVAPESPGDTVRFTITVRAENSPVNDVVVRDLLSEGFEFNHFDTDTWDANSSTQGNISGDVTITGYLSPGMWEIGDMVAGETITLVYDAVIGSGVTAGIYKDIAWARGKDIWDTSESEGSVFATAEDPGDLADIADRFVGTDVEIVTPTPDPSADAEVDEKEITEEVLGTSTVRLPATGASTVVLISVLTTMLLGISLIALSRRKKAILALPIFLLGVFAFSGKVYAETPDPYLLVRLENPASNYNEPFQLTFVAMDTLGGRALTAKCYLDGPDSSAHEFSTISINPGGDTKVCDVTDGALGDAGAYKFWVTLSAEEGTGPVTSEEVTTTYDNDGPDKPKYIEVDRKSDCKYEITIKTANDDQTYYVEVYMSDDKEFTANNNSRIRTFDMGPDEKKTFTEEVAGAQCAHRQYFAVRAFDSAGNGSDVEAEELVDTKTITINKEEIIYEAGVSTTGGASTIGIGGEGNEGAEVVTSEEEIGEGNGEEGSVLGEQVQEEETQEKGFFGKLIASPWTWVALIVLLGGLTINGLRKRNA
ncbi:TPA: hypothetical protein DCL89_03335 [candidate division WWE3 bacterium]|uniref:DUF11 domain-containing protein n=2 Tax=Katanobacteria TaxID=422282 RepID=A0A354G453_UNCKA|nr:hypothetical protein [candidate division WWE3 bacterium]HBI35791.1 hypothetical protein [candidate division WWE3 bacterium]